MRTLLALAFIASALAGCSGNDPEPRPATSSQPTLVPTTTSPTVADVTDPTPPTVPLEVPPDTFVLLELSGEVGPAGFIANAPCPAAGDAKVGLDGVGLPAGASLPPSAWLLVWDHVNVYSYDGSCAGNTTLQAWRGPAPTVSWQAGAAEIPVQRHGGGVLVLDDLDLAPGENVTIPVVLERPSPSGPVELTGTITVTLERVAPLSSIVQNSSTAGEPARWLAAA